MELIKELASIVSKQKIKNIDLLDSNSKENLTYKLYSGLTNESILNEKDAIVQLYKGDFNKMPSLKKSVQRLQKKLLNSLFFIDTNQPSYSQFQKAYVECSKNYAIIRILLDRGSRKLAIEIAEKTVSIALKYKFADLITSLSSELYYHFGALEFKKGKFERYLEINEIYSQHLMNEDKVLRYYSTFANFFLRGQGGSNTFEEILAYGEEVCGYTRKLLKKTPTYRIQLTGNLLLSGFYEVSNDIPNQIRICEEAFIFFKKEQNFPKIGRSIFGQKLVSCHMKTKEFEKAIAIGEEIIPTYISGSINWYNLHLYLFLLNFHSKDYNKAVTIFERATTNRKFKQLSSRMKEFWVISEPYIHFLIQCGYAEQKDASKQGKSFRIYKFLNDVPMYSKDKRGFNISILIAHVLLLILTEKYDKIIDRVETLNQYCYRYLRKDETYRSNCFIKMLLQLPKAGFHHERVKRYANKYYKKLLLVPLSLSKQPTEIELIPYEDLWQMVINLLKENHKK